MADDVTKFVDIEEGTPPEGGDGEASFDSTGFDEPVHDADLQAQIDRGDFIGDEVPESDVEVEGDVGDKGAEQDGGEGGGDDEKGDGESDAGDDTPPAENIDTLQEIAKDDDKDGSEEPAQPAGIPIARAGQMSREKNAAADLTQAILDGTVDKRWVDDLGGTQAVIKGIASGQIKIEQPGAEATPQQQEVPKELQTLYDQLEQLEEQHSDASIDADVDEVKKLTKEINKLNRKIITEESRIETARENEQIRQQLAANDAEKVAEVQAELIEKHVELQTDTNEYYGFIARRDVHLAKGALMSEALLAAERETFPEGEGGGDDAEKIEKIRSERKAKAIEKNASVLNQQPPHGRRGAGQRGTPPVKDIGDMSDEEFAQLSEEEKAKARGDFL